MGKFEDQLLGDLMREHGPALATAQRPAPRNKRPVWIAASAVALAAVVTVGLALVDGGTPAAFAVNQNADGSISVSIDDIAAIDPANKELERLKVPIRAVPSRPDCPRVPGGTGAGAGAGGGGGGGEPAGGPTENSPAPSGNNPAPSDTAQPDPELTVDMRPDGGVTIKRSLLTPGSSIALGVYTNPEGVVISMSVEKIESGPIPICVSSGIPTFVPAPTN
jgi:hypothetical protein